MPITVEHRRSPWIDALTHFAVGAGRGADEAELQQYQHDQAMRDRQAQAVQRVFGQMFQGWQQQQGQQNALARIAETWKQRRAYLLDKTNMIEGYSPRRQAEISQSISNVDEMLASPDYSVQEVEQYIQQETERHSKIRPRVMPNPQPRIPKVSEIYGGNENWVKFEGTNQIGFYDPFKGEMVYRDYEPLAKAMESNTYYKLRKQVIDEHEKQFDPEGGAIPSPLSEAEIYRRVMDMEVSRVGRGPVETRVPVLESRGPPPAAAPQPQPQVAPPQPGVMSRVAAFGAMGPLAAMQGMGPRTPRVTPKMAEAAARAMGAQPGAPGARPPIAASADVEGLEQYVVKFGDDPDKWPPAAKRNAKPFAERLKEEIKARYPDPKDVPPELVPLVALIRKLLT